MDVGTQKVTLQEQVALSPGDCFDAFLQEVWIGGGGLGPIRPKILVEGDPSTRKGCIRVVPGWIHEEILEASHGTFLEYHVRSGPFPVSYHRGRVEFTDLQATADAAPESTSQEGTLVTWSCSYTPLPLMGSSVSFVIRTSFRIMLQHLSKSAQAKQQQRGVERSG